MKLILSRKGFDSQAGGVASPIFPDGRMVSLPIPSGQDSVRYADIRFGDTNLGDIAAALTGRSIFHRAHAHHDPDLTAASRPRHPDWRPALGQVGAAQRHLENQGIDIGSLFLFFGWHREVEPDGHGSWRHRRGAPDLHVLFGWLQVGEILPLGTDPDAIRASHSQFADHPHFEGLWDASNTVYLASDRLIIDGLDMGVPGAGTFQHFHPGLTLTKPGATRGLWSLPGWFHPDAGATLSYHTDPARWTRDDNRCHLRTVGRGQEFVIDAPNSRLLIDWLQSLLTSRADARAAA